MSRGILRNLIVDISPLRQVPRYRWLFTGFGLASLGRQLTVVAVPYQLYEMTGSTIKVGALGLVQFAATMLVALAGGAIADAVDRRRLLTVANVLLAMTALGLLANAALAGPLEWPLYVLTGLNAAFTAVDGPTRAAAVPALVGRRLLASALALNQTMSNLAKAGGPALAGLLIATTSLQLTYALEATMFLVGALGLFRIGPMPPEGGGTPLGIRSIAEGLGFLRRSRLLKANFAIDLNAMIFGMPSALFPAIGLEMLGGDASTVGLLYAGPGVGALLAAATSGWVAGLRHQGRAVVISAAVWGLGIVGFGLTRSVPVAVALLGLAGAADVVSAVFRNAILQITVPDGLRGRLSGVHIAVTAGGPRLGDFEAGAVAAVTSVPFSVVSGGVACVLGTLAIARWAPELARYEYDPDPEPGSS